MLMVHQDCGPVLGLVLDWTINIPKKEESKESDEWLLSLQYLNANINDLTISESFLDTSSELGGINDSAIKALG